ncbi:MAG: hypothetical protein HQL42_16315 [Alphaproteobacteria bacterium]|nr:hypothetical protein [Alphaproteobacteria bacterium]
MNRRALLAALAAALIAAPLTACGRRGSLIPPEGSTYPRRFPNIRFPNEKKPEQPSEDEPEDESEDQK